MKTIGVLTSGGDAPGMNACIRSIVRSSIFAGLKVKGIKFGYDGLIKGNVFDMDISSVADIIHRGGTILGSARSKEFETEEGQWKAIEVLEREGIEGLVILGGDGTFRGAHEISEKGIKVIGIPCTIDNDMGFTDQTIGFSTAIGTVVEAIGKLRDTSSSHGRGNVLEVMGRNCGDLALYSGIAGGAESIVVPEKENNIEEIIEKVLQGKKRGKLHHIVIVAEGVGDSFKIAEKIEESTGVETKVTVLGHIQRGGTPSPEDRILASELGSAAVDLLLENKTDLAIGKRDGKVIYRTIEEAVEIKKEFNNYLYEMSKKLSI